jgi:transposase
MTPEARIAELEAVVAQQREQIATLLERLGELEARLAKDSHNSGKPPSSDRLGRKTRSLRKKSGKQPGGQLGHRGETLRLVAAPEKIVEQRPAVCVQCRAALPQDMSVVAHERRQVLDLPPVRLQNTEYRALHVRCPVCQRVTVGVFPAETPSRAQYGPRLRALAVYLVEQQLVPYARTRQLLVDLFGAHVSLGTLVRWVRQAAQTLEPVEDQITAALRRAAVLQCCSAAQRRDGHASGGSAGLGACDEHSAPDTLCDPSQTWQ